MRQPLSTTRRPENDRFLEILIATRKETRVSQRELARRLGKTQSYVSKVESGQQRMDVLELVDYCRAIGAPASLIVLKLEAVYDEMGGEKQNA